MSPRNLAAIVLVCAWGLTAPPVQALSLDEAKAQGLVCELPNGYLKAKAGSANALVQQINAKRKSAYANIAKKNGVSVEDVGILTARNLNPKC